MADSSISGASQYLHPYSTFQGQGSTTQEPRQENISQIVEYVPKLQQTGYIVGAPVAYTNSPTLPPNYKLNTPKNNVNF